MHFPRIEKAMLMAAGLGTRLRPFTDLTTKALLPVFGIPTAQFSIDSLALSGVKTFVANIHHQSQSSRAGLQNLDWFGTRLLISDETDQLLGSAGGIRNALPLLESGPFFLANADVISDVNWHALAERHLDLRRTLGVEITLAVFPAGPNGGAYREIQVDPEKKKVVGLGEIKSGSPFFIGASVLEPEAFKGIPPAGPADFVTHILEPAIRDGKVGAFYTHGIWLDIGSPKLWRDTHFALMDHLETGSFPGMFSKMWRSRIERSNERIADRFWVSKGALRSRGHAGVSAQSLFSWGAPCYWNDSQAEVNAPPLEFQLGPNSVLYGAPAEKGSLSHGIGYRKIWVGC